MAGSRRTGTYNRLSAAAVTTAFLSFAADPPDPPAGEVAGGRPPFQMPGARGRPAGEPVVDRPVVQSRIAVRQRVGARQDRDHPDRVQRRPARPRVHADLAICWLRIRESASSAVSSAVGRVCRYLSVVAMLAWPSRSFTTCRSAPPARSHEACACLRSCTLTLLSPHALRTGPHTW